MLIVANLKHAARNGETVSIGGGDFSPGELLAAAQAIEAAASVLAGADKNGVSSLYENRRHNPYVELTPFGQSLRDLRSALCALGVLS